MRAFTFRPWIMPVAGRRGIEPTALISGGPYLDRLPGTRIDAATAPRQWPQRDLMFSRMPWLLGEAPKRRDSFVPGTAAFASRQYGWRCDDPARPDVARAVAAGVTYQSVARSSCKAAAIIRSGHAVKRPISGVAIWTARRSSWRIKRVLASRARLANGPALAERRD